MELQRLKENNTGTESLPKKNESNILLWRLALAMGKGRCPKPEYDGNTFDTHVWLQNPDGHIIDPTPDQAQFAGLKKHYKAWEGKSRLKCCMDWMKQWEQHLKEELVPKVKEQLGERIVHRGNELEKKIAKMCLSALKTSPQALHCYYNILAIKKDWEKSGYKVQFGSLGYEVQEGTVFWEFG